MSDAAVRENKFVMFVCSSSSWSAPLRSAPFTAARRARAAATRPARARPAGWRAPVHRTTQMNIEHRTSSRSESAQWQMIVCGTLCPEVHHGLNA